MLFHCLLAFTVSDEKLAFWGFFVCEELFFFLLSRFSLGFNIFTVFCLDVDLFEFILLGVCLASWLGRLMFFSKCGISVTIPLDIFRM